MPVIDQDTHRMRLPAVGSPAPQFEAESTQGRLRLSDWRGRWMVLFCQPGSFSPVCTTEMVEFARRAQAFFDRNTALVCLSVDSLGSNIGWLQRIRELFGIEIPYPVVADADRSVAQLYGMLQAESPDSAGARSVFIIDDKQFIRAIFHYPPELGRNVNEVLRSVDALQMVDRFNVAMPANWKPGDKVLVHPPRTFDEALQERPGVESIDWWFGRMELPLDMGR